MATTASDRARRKGCAKRCAIRRSRSWPCTHFASPEALLAGARALYGAAPSGVLLTVGAATFDLGERLSEPVERALEELVRSGILEWL